MHRRMPRLYVIIIIIPAYRNEIFLGGERRGACRLSPRLHHTSQNSVYAILQTMYVRRPPLVYSFPFQQYASFLINDPSKWPSIITDDPDGAMADRVCWGDSMFEALVIKAIRGFFIYFSNSVNDVPLTYHRKLDGDSTQYSVSGAKRREWRTNRITKPT